MVLPAERVIFDEPQSITPRADFWGLVGASPDHGRFPRSEHGARYHDIPPGILYTLPGGRTVGPAGWIVDRDDRLLTDLSPDYRRERYISSRHPLTTVLRLPPALPVAGRVAVLATLSADGYFGHWMMDLLPRAAMITKAGLRFEDFDGVYIPRPRHRYESELIDRLGIHVDQIIDALQVPHVRAEQLIVPSWHANVFVASSWCCETLRALAPPTSDHARSAATRIFISRSGTNHRRIVNEPELLREVLEPGGFISVCPERMPSAVQAELFASATVVVTPLGSSMANLVHCQPGTQVVEILNPRCVQSCTLAIASQLGLDYHVVLARGTDARAHEITEDLRLPAVVLQRGIEQALVRARSEPRTR